LKENAISLVRNAMNMMKVDKIEKENKQSELLDNFFESVKKFRVTRDFAKSKELQVSEENILHKLNEKISYEMDSILIDYISYVDEIMEYMKLGKEIQKEINTQTEKLELMVNALYENIGNEERELEEN